MSESECVNEINRGLRVWWSEHEELAEEIAEQVVNFCTSDCYVEEVDIENCGECRTSVRVLVLSDCESCNSELALAAERLELIFGTPVQMACAIIANYIQGPSHSKNFTDDD